MTRREVWREYVHAALQTKHSGNDACEIADRALLAEEMRFGELAAETRSEELAKDDDDAAQHAAGMRMIQYALDVSQSQLIVAEARLEAAREACREADVTAAGGEVHEVINRLYVRLAELEQQLGGRE